MSNDQQAPAPAATTPTAGGGCCAVPVPGGAFAAVNDCIAPLDEDLAEVLRRELLLLRPDIRAQPEAVLALLHPGFLEFGASGRIWDIGTVVGVVVQDSIGESVEAYDLEPVRLCEDVILLTYTSHVPQRTCLRSSVWLRHPYRGWLLRFHQGTIRPR